MGVREVVRGMGAVLTTHAYVGGSACSVRLTLNLTLTLTLTLTLILTLTLTLSPTLSLACVAGSACSVRLSAGSSMKQSTPRLVSAKTCVVEGSRAASSTHLVRARVT